MKGVYLSSVALLISFLSFSQVGIGTTNPSNAAMLDISSSVNGTTFKGFMPPRVPSQIERDAITTTSIDTGLLVFVESTGTFEIWNGIFWESVYTLSTMAQTLAFQDFDTNLTWNYTVTPVFYNTAGDIWDSVITLGAGTSAIDNVSDNFLGCRDLNNPNGGGNFFHEIAFVNVNISGVVNARVAFDYDVFEFDNGDDVRYELFYDDVGQGQVVFINGNANYSEEGTLILNIPGSVTNVRLTFGITQNGDADFAGFDNFRVYGQ
ncbi:hypothetical protein ATE92_2383 [Ulvibacter sp. MAR_2010_11]|uniref:hypothetical protein n=1 Tax=Ulvibacter sp. MAR_2010_11 TaxID=1250229 RepID=UPI000C2B831F|nr:hypothetical protein [Ulvibacter sp. MAR_2010_11]PKA84212.1 hypothetical protein ATE92_2383 [Ulvibacter sp. MAR_2010_11]